MKKNMSYTATCTVDERFGYSFLKKTTADIFNVNAIKLTKMMTGRTSERVEMD